MTLLGYNIDGDELVSNTAIQEQVKRTGSNWHLVINHKDYARAIRPFTKRGVVYRAFNPFGDNSPTFDNDFWANHSARKTADWMKAQLHDVSEMYLTAGNNEPSSNPGNRRQLVKWLSDLAKYLYEQQQHGAIGEIAVAKTLERDEIEAGVWDELIETMHDLGDWHIWTFHEYTTGLAPANFIPDYPYNLLNKSIANTASWVKQIPLVEGGYHIGRWHWLRQRAIDIGKPMKRVVITECVYDYMEDANANGEWLKNVLRPKFDYGGFEGLKGWEGHKPYWKWLLGKNDDLSWQEFMYESIAWNARASAPECEGFCLFGLNPDWYMKEGVDLSRGGVDHFRYLVETVPVTHSSTPPPLDEEKPFMFPVTISGQNQTNQTPVKVNVRNDRSTQSQIVGVIPAYPETVTGYAAAPDTTAKNGYIWRYVEVTIANTNVSGYVAENFVKVTELPDTPLFYDLSLPGQPTIRMSAEEWHKYVEVQYAFVTYLSAIVGSEQ